MLRTINTMKVIGICGFIDGGKNSVARIVKEYYGTFTSGEGIAFTNSKGTATVEHLSFAGVLKDVVSVVFGWDRAMLEGDTRESRIWREQVDEWWSARLQIPGLTPRWVLQSWGTDVLRNHFHEDIWLAAAERRMLQSRASIIVITDCRFPNEIAAIQRMGGDIVWVKRGPLPEWYNNYVLKGEIPIGVHISEYGWLTTNFTRIFKNNGTLEDLRADVIRWLRGT